MCIAVMDKTKDDIQYLTSIFYKWGWDISLYSDQSFDTLNNYLFGKYKYNAWHVSKSIMLFSLMAIPFVYKPFLGKADYLLFGSEWILVFNLFYNHILKYNPKK